jgi:hypothetical protein
VSEKRGKGNEGQHELVLLEGWDSSWLRKGVLLLLAHSESAGLDLDSCLAVQGVSGHERFRAFAFTFWHG